MFCGRGQLYTPHPLQKLACSGLYTVQSIGKLHQECRSSHGAGQEESIESRKESGDQKNGAEHLGAGGDGANAHARQEQRNVKVPIPHQSGSGQAGPLALFLSFYLATFFTAAFLGFPWLQWVALFSTAVATAATVAIFEGGKWRLGLFVPPRRAVAELLLGVAGATVLIGAADLLVLATTPLRHGRGSGLPWPELVLVFIPAVLHEELLFRGYVFQKLWLWHRRFAIVAVSGLFAALHLWNDDVTSLAITNVFLGGVLLSLAYERYRRLWFPIGVHLMWNLMSGPILGYDVSGYDADRSVFTVVGTGPALLTGGAFGIEGSVWMTVVEGLAIVVLWRMNAERRTQNEEVRS